MNQVLDETGKKSVLKKTFSKLSFISSIVTVLVYIYASNLPDVRSNQTPSEIFSPASNEFLYAMYLGLLSIIVGSIVAIISFIKKEPSSIIKWIGGALNIGIFIFYTGRMIFHMW